MTLIYEDSSVSADDKFKKGNIKESLKVKENISCPECGSQLKTDSGRAEVYCSRCGMVIEENLVDLGPEWRAFDHEQRDKRTRVGAPTTNTIHDKGLPTVIDWRNKDSHGRNIPEASRAQIYRLRKLQRRVRVSGSGERNLALALSVIDRNSSNLSLPRSVREDASVIYRKAVDKNIIRGRSIEGVAAASIYTACRRCDVPRTLDEIAEACNISKKEVGRTYRFLARELNIKLEPTSPADYVPRFASKIGLSKDAETKSISIIQMAVSKGLTSGRGPTGVAAAALYIASVLLGERKTQKEVADASGVTEVTIRNRYKELSQELDALNV
ncbi:transcription initiation factor IIB [Methanobrevibacter sp.]